MSEPELQDAYPLTSAQQGILSHCLRTTDPTLYHSQVTFTLRGMLDSADLIRAWQRLVQSHEVLRTLFVWEDMDEPLQAVLSDVDPDIDVEDWSGQGASLVDDAWQGMAALSGSWIAALIRNGLVSSREAVDAHIQHIEHVNPALNAMVAMRFISLGPPQRVTSGMM